MLPSGQPAGCPYICFSPDLPPWKGFEFFKRGRLSEPGKRSVPQVKNFHGGL